MKKIPFSSLGCLLVIVSLAGLASAGDNFSIPVSCSIPAIPGVNVPLVEDETVADTNTERTAVASAEEQTPCLIEQENQGQEPLVLVKTLYDR